MTKNRLLSFGNENDPGLRRFLQEIKTFKHLSRNEELELSLRVQAGDEKAVNLLVEANLHFLVDVAKDFQSYDLSLSDLINEGVLGLKKAAWKFDGNRGHKFITYAVWYIKQAMQLALMNNSAVKIPINKQITARKVNRATRYLQQLLLREPQPSEIALHLNIDVELVSDCIRQQKSVILIFESLCYRSVLENIRDPGSDITNKHDAASDTKIIRSMLNSLPKRYSTVLTSYFGLEDPQVMTIKEIGEMMNLSPERVRQLKNIALKKLIRRGPKFLASHGIYR